MKKLLLSACVLCLGFATANAQLVQDDFMSGLNIGDNAEAYEYQLADSAIATRNPKVGQWNRTIKTTDQGGSSPKVVAPLTYSGYVDSGKDNAMALIKSTTTRVSGYVMVDDNSYSTETYYTAFLVKPTLVGSGYTGDGQDFFCLDGHTFVNNQRARIFIKRGPTDSSSNRTFTIGLSESGASGAFLYDDVEFPIGTTVLVVLAYSYENGKVALYVNPDPAKTEAEQSTPLSYNISNGISASNGIRTLAVKQRSNFEVEIGHFRFAKSWSSTLSNESTSIGDNQSDKGTIVSAKYYNLNGVEISAPADNGIYIQKAVYENGSVETSKILK